MKISSHRILASLSIAFVILAQLTAWAAVTTLAVNINGSGSVSLNPTNSVYPQGAVVTATALPSSGWKFSFWSGDANGTENPLNVTMNANKTIIANFVEVPVY